MLQEIRNELNDDQRRQNDLNKECGSYNWLTTLPLKDHDYNLNKEEFWDALRIRYNWPLPRLPSECACGCKFDLSHALSCKKGGFIALRHNEVRDITALFLKEVCHDVKKEPLLIELGNERMQERTAATGRESRLDISASGFWVKGQRAFFDVRVFDPNAQRHRNSDLKRCYEKDETEKKRKYNERILQVENGAFTPLVFSSHGGFGREGGAFFKRLSEMIAEKRNIAVSVATTFIRTRISFSLLRSTLLCLRGSRSLRRTLELNEVDIDLVNSISVIPES